MGSIHFLVLNPLKKKKNPLSRIHCDIGQNLEINLCNLLYLIFLRNFCYFGIRVFISLF